MTKSICSFDGFPRVSNRKVKIDFSGGNITSYGGLQLLSKADRNIGFTRSISSKLSDSRQQAKVTHKLLPTLRQRIYAIACGCEDINDHDELRHDLSMQSAVNRVEKLASSSTVWRLEDNATKEWIVKIHEVLVNTFMNSYDEEPEEIILDFDASDIPIHGNQELKQFHGYYDHYCYLPLYVFCGEHLLVSYLRPCRIDGAKHSGAILKLLVNRIRKEWKNTRIVFRGDGGFCRGFILKWCERNKVDYVVGMPKNAVTKRLAEPYLQISREHYLETGESHVIFRENQYGAKSWKGKKRRLIIKAEYLPKGENPRFLITNMDTPGEELYRRIYCARGDAENRIKEQQLDLFGTRTSSKRYLVNQLRILLSGCAYTLLKALRRIALKGTKLQNAMCGTIREKLLKIGAVVTRNTRTIKFSLSSSYPLKDLFINAAQKLILANLQ